MDTDDQDHVCASQLSHFDHKDEFMQCLQVIIQLDVQVKEATKALNRLTTIVRERKKRGGIGYDINEFLM